MQLYQPPEAGDPDHADPTFKPRLRDCGRCSRPFETSAAWRYFCPKCRVNPSCEEDSIAYLFDVSKEATGRRRIIRSLWQTLRPCLA